MYLKAIKGEKTLDSIYNILLEIEKGSVGGRIVGGKTNGIQKLFVEKKELAPMVTKPVINQEKDFSVKLNNLYNEFSEIDPKSFLYTQIFVLENLGFCIFSSFALLNNTKSFELMAQMFEGVTGVKTNAQDILSFAQKSIERELEIETHFKNGIVQKNIPEFTKVLYRYFSLEK